MNTRTAVIDTNPSNMFTLLLEFNLVQVCGQKRKLFELQNSPSRAFAIDGKIYTAILANL